jgi:hypothetical protein
MKSTGQVEKRSVSVSELGAYGGDCEMQAYLSYHLRQKPKQPSKESVKGVQIHSEIERSAKAYERRRSSSVISRDSRCYVATAVYGKDAIETNRLRQWRDAKLLPTRKGRVFVAIYYRLSPYLCRYITEGGRLERVLRNTIDWQLNRISLEDFDDA